MDTVDEITPDSREDVFWLRVARGIQVATVVVVGLVVAFIWAANAVGGRDRREGEAAAEGLARLRGRLAPGSDMTPEDPKGIWAKAKPLFGDMGRTYFAARAAREAILEQGHPADAMEIVAGGVALAGRGHYFAARRDGTRPTFGDYCKLYVVARNGGMSHDDAIETIDRQAQIAAQGR